MGVFFYVSGLCLMISEFLEIKWIFIPRSEVVFCKRSLGAAAPPCAPEHGQLGAQNAAICPQNAPSWGQPFLPSPVSKYNPKN